MVELLSEKSQVPEWFVSHWWGEPIVAFHRCVELHRKIRDLPDTVGYWVCAYANRQHALKGEVTADPRETSFFRALQLSKGVLLILDEATADSGPATPFTRIWCAFEEFVALRRGERRLLDIAADSSVKTQLLTEGVAPADEEEARKCGAGYPAAKVRSDREKSFPLEVLKAGLTLQLERAQASEESDRWHILNCIAGRGLDLEPLASHPSYERVNRTLRAIFAVAGWRQAVELDIAEALGLPEVLRADEEREQLVLDFTGSQGIGDRHAAQLGAALAPGLRDLELSCRWCTEVSHEFLVQLAPSLRTLTSLLRLKLGFGFAAKRVQPVGVEALANALPRSLKELFLDFNDGNSLGDESLQAIALRMPPELEILTLCMAGWVHLGDLGLVALARSLPSTLRRLTLDCFILSRRPGIPGDQGLASLAAGWPQLEVLDLSFKSNCKIGDAGLAALVLPRSLKSLRLVLDGCENLSDRGLAALGANLPPGLERLRLFCNETGCGDPSLAGLLLPASLRHLELGFGSAAAADRGLSSLRLPEALSLLSLSLPGSFLDGAGLAALALRLPQALGALHLCLSGCANLRIGLASLGRRLPRSLRHLTATLDDCECLSDGQLAGLAQSLPELETLRLHLSGCALLGDPGVSAVAQRMPRTLQHLELDAPEKFSDAGLAALRTALEGMTPTLTLAPRLLEVTVSFGFCRL
ncbi:unnamed protein product [Effrenium voratum]|nr:unnamed protein product [Effrenium voratum]